MFNVRAGDNFDILYSRADLSGTRALTPPKPAPAQHDEKATRSPTIIP